MAFGEQGQGFRNQPIPIFEAGNTTLINSLGLFTYNGAPGLGTIVSSDTPPGTTGDGNGNAILPGLTNYFNTGSGWVAVQIFDGDISFSTAATSAGPWTQIGQILSAGNGMSISQTNNQIVISSSGGLGPGGLAIGNNGVEGIVGSGAGFKGNLELTQTDVTPITVTTATAITRITKAYPVTGGTSQIGTHYRLKFSGNGAMGAVAVAFSFVCAIGATGSLDWDMTWPASTLAASNTFQYVGEVDVYLTSTGAAANWNVSGWMTITDVTTGNSATKVLVDTGNTHDSTINETIEIDFQWAATSAGRTVTNLESSFKRIGA